jgi:dephospho-CoA kinase
MRVGLSGGVGSGKSTVSARLRELGALVVDADAVAREVVEPGTAGLMAVAERFGADVLRPDGTLDRAALAGIVFTDEKARTDLNAILHPLIQRRTKELMAAAGPEDIVVYDVPLLVESGQREGFDVVVVVLADEAARVERLAGRGMAEDDARARMGVQASDEQRRAMADVVLDNNGSREDLVAQVDALWSTWT